MWIGPEPAQKDGPHTILIWTTTSVPRGRASIFPSLAPVPSPTPNPPCAIPSRTPYLDALTPPRSIPPSFEVSTPLRGALVRPRQSRGSASDSPRQKSDSPAPGPSDFRMGPFSLNYGGWRLLCGEDHSTQKKDGPHIKVGHFGLDFLDPQTRYSKTELSCWWGSPTEEMAGVW